MTRQAFRLCSAAVVVFWVTSGARGQVSIQLDYTLDTNNFFTGQPARQTALQTAANTLAARLSDSLTAITPGGGNTWTAIFAHPGTGSTQQLVDLTIPANVIRVFAGGRPLGGSTLGIGGPGGRGGSGTQAFVDNLVARGQPGALGPAASLTDFGPWGGSITFDTTASWNFNLGGPVAGQNDFLSVAVHELAHLIGFGTADSFLNRVNTATNRFTGSSATSLFGSNPPVEPGGGHWASGVSYLGQEASMTPSILVGTRKNFTELDFAGLRDMGWQVSPVPEPSTLLLCGILVPAVYYVRRRRAA